ncbi:MAG TPA: phosphodiester glycosidase family protein [Lacipirellulaceae bacterium]|nr:phosphodiester glycosidase family protein [Lacipirellulaceae bacterium]
MKLVRAIRIYLLVLCGVGSGIVDAAQTVTHPYLGVTMYHETETSPRPLNINVATIDLSAPGIRFVVTPEGPAPQPVFDGAAQETIVQTTRQFVDTMGVQLAVNASFFNIDDEHVVNGQTWTTDLGLTASNGNAYSTWQPLPNNDNNYDAALNISASNQASIVKMPASVPTGYETKPATVLYNTVTGQSRLLKGGVVTAKSNCGSLCDLNPRTAVGLTSGNTELILMTIDGRQPGVSEGVTLVELAQYMASYGARNALNLDGGGSTTMVADYYGDRGSGILVNQPSGSERSVGVNLGLYALPNGDYNQDNVVDAADYVTWRKTIGGTQAYNAWQQNFGMPAWTLNQSIGSDAAVVPEPAVASLFALALAFVAGARKKRRG